jgi:hypothetical protein
MVTFFPVFSGLCADDVVVQVLRFHIMDHTQGCFHLVRGCWQAVGEDVAGAGM